MLEISVILFLAGLSVRGQMLQQMCMFEGVLFSPQICFKVDSCFYQVCSLPTDYSDS